MRPNQRRDRIVEVGPRVIRVAKRAIRQDTRSVLKIEQPTFQVHKFSSQGLVATGKDIVRAAGQHAVEEHVDGDLKAAICGEEEVLWCEDGEGFDDAYADEEEDYEEGEADVLWDRLDREVVVARGGAQGAVVGDGFGDEDWAEEDGKGADTIGVRFQRFC